MADVIVVAKTRMSKSTCIGGVLGNGRFVRLLDENGYNQSTDTEYEIGDVYTISYRERPGNKPPHLEDILVEESRFKFKFGSIERMIQYLIDKLNIPIWEGNTEILFDGKLQWTNGGSGYISESGGIPDQSVGFWISDKDLKRRDFNDKVRYSYPPIEIILEGFILPPQWRNISFVGYQNPVDEIPKGTLVRVSLARWWKHDGADEERCYLQLSGWYGL